MEDEIDLDKLEDVEVSFSRDAFAPKVMYCDECDLKMEKINKDITISNNIKIRLNVFRCQKCHEESIGINEAKKLDKALMMNKFLSNEKQFSFKRKLSFDGDSYIFRLPSDLTKGKKPKEVEIIPLESREALIRFG